MKINLLARSTDYACRIKNVFASREIDWVPHQVSIMPIEAQLVWKETHLRFLILGHDAALVIAIITTSLEIDRNLLKF